MRRDWPAAHDRVPRAMVDRGPPSPRPRSRAGSGRRPPVNGTRHRHPAVWGWAVTLLVRAGSGRGDGAALRRSMAWATVDTRSTFKGHDPSGVDAGTNAWVNPMRADSASRR